MTTRGSYQDSKDQQITKGYMRAPDGTVTTITVPDAHGQVCTDINDLGWIVGSSWPKPFKHETGFVRKRNGTLKRVAVPGYLVEFSRINASGAAVGTAIAQDTGVSLLRMP